ncbi:MAG: response regulator [Cyanobacteria bacterium P01_F01_bin.150]
MNEDIDKKLRILVVDDNPTNLRVLSDSIRHEKEWNILFATDGESAIEQVLYAKPDLILLDVMMPGVDGFETCRRLKSQNVTNSIPVIFMTALSDTTHKVQGLELGAVDYITKPFQKEEVLARVRLHLKLSQLNQNLKCQNELLAEKIIEKEAAENQIRLLAQELEHRVEQRTEELALSYQKLQQAQLQMVQHEKMASLGNLVAGVAHEVNNPIGFLNGSINNAKDYLQELLDYLDIYQQYYPPEVIEVQDYAEKIELEFIREDFPKLLASMQHASDRIRAISNSLRTFSRADTQEKVKADIHEGLNSTLLILKYRLKANEVRPEIQIHKEYGELPPIFCFPGQLNQVFMNLLANAIDMFDEVAQTLSWETLESAPQIITLQTNVCADQQSIAIHIRDNGKGMPQDVLHRVFDYLFTTKDVGQGTGLGLTIAHQIITEAHHGQLTVQSAVAQGTEFCIRLPINN